MATSGTIDGTISGYKPYLRINWSRIETDIAGNRSKLRLQLYLIHPYTVKYSATKRGVLQGSSFSSSTRVNGTGSTLLRTQEIWVGHNADGSKTQTLSASYNLDVTYSGSWLGQLTVSGPAYITAIPRGSTLSAFSFANSLQIGTANTINYTVKRHSGNFRHQFQLRDGSVTIAQWDNVSSNGSDTLSLTGTQVNTLLGRMSTVTSKSFTLRVATRSGINGGWIGSAVTRNATVSVNANVEPTISSTSAVPIGNSWAVGKGFYVQGQTGVQAEFSSAARGGAGVRSRSISIGSLSSGGAVVGNVFRHSQTRVNTTGNIKITYKITDTRGRSASSERTINFRAYTPPQITSFTAGRSNPTSTTVTVKSQGSIHGMGGQNTGTMTVKQQGVTNPVRTRSLNNTTPSFNDSFNRTVVTASSVGFTITVTDSLGNSATSTTTVGTAFMEFSIRKGTGVGIGKVHERGVLDVDGDAYYDGDLYVNNVNISNAQSLRDYLNATGKIATDTIKFWQDLPQGTYFISPGNIPGQPSSYGVINHTTQRVGSSTSDFNTIWYTQNEGTIYRKSGNGNVNNAWRPVDEGVRGRNESGNWIRFNDGTQICWNNALSDNSEMGFKRGNLYSSDNFRIDYPSDFIELPAVTVSGNVAGLYASFATAHNSSNRGYFLLKFIGEDYSTLGGRYNYIAIGRWK